MSNEENQPMQQSFLERADELEQTTVGILVKFGPWAITFPTAWAIGAAAIKHFAWPWAVGLIAGAGVEILGVAVNYTALELFAYNQTKDEDEPTRPFIGASILALIYFASVVALTVGVERDYLLGIFPVLSLVGGITIGMRIQHSALITKHKRIVADRNRLADDELKLEGDRLRAAEEAAKAAEETAKAESLRLQNELQQRKEAKSEARRERREAAKAAKEIAETADPSAEFAKRIAESTTFLGLPINPSYQQFKTAMASLNGRAPQKKDAIAGIISLGKSERTAYTWWEELEAMHEKAIQPEFDPEEEI